MDNLISFTDTREKFPKSWNQTNTIYAKKMYVYPRDMFYSQKAISRFREIDFI